jgi:hypothetical protein
MNIADYCFFEVRKSCLIIVAKRVFRQERILKSTIIVKDDRAIDALLSFTKELNKSYSIRVTDAVESAGGLAVEIFDVFREERQIIKKQFIQLLQQELRES